MVAGNCPKETKVVAQHSATDTGSLCALRAAAAVAAAAADDRHLDPPTYIHTLDSTRAVQCTLRDGTIVKWQPPPPLFNAGVSHQQSTRRMPPPDDSRHCRLCGLVRAGLQAQCLRHAVFRDVVD